MSVNSKDEIYYKFIFPKRLYIKSNAIITLLDKYSDYVKTYDELQKTSDLKRYIDTYIATPKYFALRIYFDDTTGKTRQAGGVSLMVSVSPDVQNSDPHNWIKFKDNGKTIYCSTLVSSSPNQGSGSGFFYNYSLPGEIIQKADISNDIVHSRFHQNWYFTNQNKIDAYVPHIGQEKVIFQAGYFKQDYQYGYYGAAKYYINFTDNNNNIYQPGSVYYQYNADSKHYKYGEYPPYKSTEGKYYVSSNGIEVTRHEYPTNECMYDSLTNKYYLRYYASTNNKPLHIRRDINNTVLYINGATQFLFDDGTQYTGTVIDFCGSNTSYVTKEVNSQGETIYKLTDITSSFRVGVTLSRTVETAQHVIEDVKRDLIRLEVTRRILNYSTDTKIQNKLLQPITIPNVIGTGTDAKFDFSPPDEYNPSKGGIAPLPIDYKLLRDTLNDKDPYTDQETMLIIWVANGDPDAISDSDSDKVQKLHDLNWQQYAIPISIRCCFKNGNYSNNRFWVSYPAIPGISGSTCRYFIMRNAQYDLANPFNKDEVLYIPGIIDRTDNYIVSHCRTGYIDHESDYGIPNIHKRLFNNYSLDEPAAVYIRKQRAGASYTHELQDFYIFVDNTSENGGPYYKIDKQKAICVRNKDNTGNIDTKSYLNRTCTLSTLTENLTGSPRAIANINKWNYSWDRSITRIPAANEKAPYYYCGTYIDSCVVVFFDKTKFDTDKLITKTGYLTIHNYNGLAERLNSIYPSTIDANGNKIENTFAKASSYWTDLYLSSFGFLTKCNWSNVGLSDRGSEYYLPLDYLDGFLSLTDPDTNESTQYGLKTDNGIIVGFQQVYDYDHTDQHHFHYESEYGTDYKLIQKNISNNEIDGTCYEDTIIVPNERRPLYTTYILLP